RRPVVASPFLSSVFACSLECALRLVLCGKLLENPAPGRRDGVLRKIVSRLQGLFQTPEGRLQESEDGFFEGLRVSQRVLSVIDGEWLFPPCGFLLRLRESMSFGIQFTGKFVECAGDWA